MWNWVMRVSPVWELEGRQTRSRYLVSRNQGIREFAIICNECWKYTHKVKECHMWSGDNIVPVHLFSSPLVVFQVFSLILNWHTRIHLNHRQRNWINHNTLSFLAHEWSLIVFFVLVLYFILFGLEDRALKLLGKLSAIELYPQPLFLFYFSILI